MKAYSPPLFTALLCVLLLGACSVPGGGLRHKEISTFTPGETTREQVQASLGEPSSVVRHPDGTVVLVYSKPRTADQPEALTPSVGTLAAQTEPQADAATFRFGSDGRLLDYSSLNTIPGAGAAVAAQPRSSN